MRWNEEEEVGRRRCVVDGVVIVGVDGVDRRPWPPCQRILGQVLMMILLLLFTIG